MKNFKKYFKSYIKEIIFGPTFKLIETITELIIPILIASMIDVGVANNDTKYILTYGAIVIGLNVVGIVVSIISQKLAARASVGIGSSMRSDLYKKINTFSHVELDKYSTATINNRITHDVTRIQQAISMVIRMVMRTPFLLIGSMIMAMTIDLKLSLIFLVAAPLILAVVIIILKATVPLYDNTQKNLDNVSNITRENLQGARVIRSFNKQDYEETRFEKATEKLSRSSIKVSAVSSLLNPLTSTIINFSIVAILWFGGIQVNVGALTQGQIIAFINYLTQISAALISLANIIVALIKAINCGKRVNEVFNTTPSISSPEHATAVITEHNDIEDSEYEVEFKNVSFAYPNMSKNAINNLNLKVKKGQTIGIIGGTGSGKSTVVNLLPRFYDTTKGTVKIKGKDVKEYNLSTLRGLMGIVPQKSVLFSGTLRENMQWRKPDATDEEIYRAIKTAQAEEFVKELDGKLDYKVQAGGKNFSGGQRQRLTIARAFVGNPEILILDDSASALDFQTDANLRHAIKTDAKDATVFLVSQRVNTIRNSDQIIVLDKGNVVGIGKHKELMESCAVYKEIYESQTK
ncbi:MAG: ABC transporter ATP-binding protein/permease [Firmicutes bacterium]|nr:ABC transporter ATP-binding protein/permease [Bacillota bacterium]MDY5042223.1 ABC transporter ATP-binding protein [Eubacteriales bacterium]